MDESDPDTLIPPVPRRDRTLVRLVRNSAYLFSSNVVSAVLSIITANFLGVANLGLLGIVMSFVGNTHRLLSFRMGDVVVKYMGEYLARHELQRAAAIAKAAFLAEAATSLVSFGLMAALAPLGARYIAGDPSTTWLFLFFGVSILTSLVLETATGILQVTHHFGSQAIINLAQSLATAFLIGVAFINQGGLLDVLWAYLAGKVVLGLAPTLLALYWLPKATLPHWERTPLSLLPPRRELVGFAVSTNFSATINMITRDSEVLWVGYFFSPLIAGYFKTALSIINLLVMPITPFISTSYPEINQSIVQAQWQKLRYLLTRITSISAAWTVLVAASLLMFGRQILFTPWNILGHEFIIFKSEFLPAHSILLILLIGFGAANILFWNRPLLLALGLPNYSLKTGVFGMVMKVGLALILLPSAGYLTEAVLLTVYFVVTVGANVWKGLSAVWRLEHIEETG